MRHSLKIPPGTTDRAGRHPIAALTVVELIVVIAVMAGLLALLVPAIGQARSAALGAKCLGNLRNYGNALLIYIEDQNGLPWWNRQSYPASAQPPSTRPEFEVWLRPYLHQKKAQRLRCPLMPPGAVDASFNYAGNANLAHYFPKVRGIPAPSSRIVLAAEMLDFNNFYVGSPFNRTMYGISQADATNRDDGGAGATQIAPAQFHGPPNHRGLHFFFLDGHARLVQPENGDWRQGKGDTYGNATNGGIFYDYHQFNAIKNGTWSF